MRPLPALALRPLRGAAYDADDEIIVVHGGEGASHGTVLYELYTNTWHELKPEEGPDNSVSQPGFTYDPVNRVFVLFGSQFGSDAQTWLFDLSKNEWRVLKTELHPPADKSSPILAADTRNGIVLASVKGADGLETWSLDVARAEWRRLDAGYEPEQNDEGANGDRNRVLLYLPDRNLFVLECRTKNEQQIWTFRYADAPRPSPPPQNVRLSLQGDNAVRLEWSAPEDSDFRKYNIYRAADSKPWQRDWKLVAAEHEGTSFVDRLDRANRQQPYCYRVEAIDGAGRISTRSRIARTRPPVMTDVSVWAVGPREVAVDWKKPAADGVSQIQLERAAVTVYSTDQGAPYPVAARDGVGSGRGSYPANRPV